MKKSFLFCLLICSINLFPQSRDAEQAREIAATFFCTEPDGKLLVPANETLELVYTRPNERADAPVKNLFYIFNKKNGEGFVIISGDERAKTVLGYSNTGNFNPLKFPDGMTIFFNRIAKGINNIPENYTAVKYIKSPISIKKIDGIGAWIRTNWGQNYPYNSMCPIDVSGNNCSAGSGPVAMAQIINFFGFPLRSVVGSHIDDYDYSINYYHQSSNLNIPLLIRRCGDAAKAIYCNGNTSTTTTEFENIANALKENFSFSPDIKIKSRGNYIDSKWEDLIIEEFTKGRPVLYCGQDTETQIAHTFICDGYEINEGLGDLKFFHFNFGWGSANEDVHYDMYFTLSINPVNDSIKYNFNDNQKIITGIKPYCAGKNICMEKLIMYPEKTSRVEINFGVNLEVKNLRNEDKYYTQFDLTSYIENENKEKIPIIYGQFAYQGLIYLPLTTCTQWIGDFVFVPDTVKNGNYKLYAGYYLPYNKEPNMNYHYAMIKKSKESSIYDSIVPIPTYTGLKNYLEITITDDSVYFNKNISDLKIFQADIFNEINFSYSESNIRFNSDEIVKNVSINTLTGARIKTIPVNKMGEITINTNDLPKACYLVRVETDKGRINGKFIKH